MVSFDRENLLEDGKTKKQPSPDHVGHFEGEERKLGNLCEEDVLSQPLER